MGNDYTLGALSTTISYTLFVYHLLIITLLGRKASSVFQNIVVHE